jgi:hypothetical protein
LSLSPLCKALALYLLLDEQGSTDAGVSLREIERRWQNTGLRMDDLQDALAVGEQKGDFELVTQRNATRVRAAGFERRQLNPSTLEEIEMLLAAYNELREIQSRMPGGTAYGRRTVDALI